MARLIDTDELLGRVERAIKNSNRDRGYLILGSFVKEMLANCPTVDAEPVRHGCWKEKRKYEVGAAVDDDGWIEFEELCSVCGKWVKTQWRSPLYCPKCGAKMDEVSE